MSVFVKNESMTLSIYSEGDFPYSSQMIVESEINWKWNRAKFPTEINPSGKLEVDLYIEKLLKDVEFEVGLSPEGSFYLYVPGQKVNQVRWTGIKVKARDAAWYWNSYTALACKTQKGDIRYRPEIKSLGLTPGFLDKYSESL